VQQLLPQCRREPADSRQSACRGDELPKLEVGATVYYKPQGPA